MPPKNLWEETLDSTQVFNGRLLDVRRDRVRLPDGKTSTREYIVHPGAVVVLALTDDDQLLLERQHRYPLHRDFIELPAGKIDPGEATLDCARRELLEETGYVAGRWQYLTTVYPCIGYADERLVYYVARELNFSGHQPDDDEFLEIFTLPWREALARVGTGEICEAKTVVGLLWLEKFLGGTWMAAPAP